jgi:putative peptide zinc metalloprotease protein
VGAKALHFTAIVSQGEAAELFNQQLHSQGVKFKGAADKSFAVSGLHVIPYERDELPSAALGWAGGGDIEVSRLGKDGKKAKESFFEVRANLIADASNTVALLHGRTGVLYIDLPSRPIAVQLKNSISQLLQKRYKL